MRNILRKIGKYVGNVLFSIVIIITIIAIYYVFQIHILKKDYANLCGYTFFTVITGSMNDTIKIGDAVIVQITQNVEENDIIVYKEEQSFITHRIIRKDNDKIVTKGDANNAEDKPINQEQVLGKVIKIIPNIGTWQEIIKRPEVIITFIVGIILLAIAVFLL